jgi:hypothetical protein
MKQYGAAVILLLLSAGIALGNPAKKPAPPPLVPAPPSQNMTQAINSLTLEQCRDNLRVTLDYANRMRDARDALEVQLSQMAGKLPPPPPVAGK